MTSRDEETVASLVRRLEAATGPDRDLDGDIAIAVGPWSKYALGDGCWDWRFNGVNFGTRPPEYTRSLDAALSLVPDGHLVDLESTRTERNDQYTWWVWRPEIADKNRCGPRRNRVAALCIAALRAQLSEAKAAPLPTPSEQT